MITASDAKKVDTREGLVLFIESMLSDYRLNGATWENGDLESFLEGMAGCVQDMDGYYKHTGEDVTKLSRWRLFADILGSAMIYE